MVQDCVFAQSSEFQVGVRSQTKLTLVQRVHSSEKGPDIFWQVRNKARFFLKNPKSDRFGVWRKDRAKPWFDRFGVPRKTGSFSELPTLAGSEFGERTGPNLSSAGFEFGERTGPNPGSTGSEFRERPVLSPNSQPWQARSLEKGQGQTLVLQVLSSEKGPGRILVRQVRSSEKDRFFLRTPNPGRLGVRRKDRAKPQFCRF